MRFINAILVSKWTKVVVFLTCLVPLGILIWQGFHNDLSANPIQYVEHDTGDWTLLFLVFTLSITPLRKILHVPQLIRFRRMLGLFAFFYVCLHFTTWITLDRAFDWRYMLDDVVKRPYITVGFSAFLLLIPLAITSTAGMIRRLGGKRWQLLHRLIYVSAILGVIHFYWLVKSDTHKPIRYAWVFGILLSYRLFDWIRTRRKKVPARASRAASTTVETV